MMARKPSHFGSNHQPRPVGSGPGLASVGSGRRTPRRVKLLLRWDRERVERDGDGMAVAPMLDDRGAVLDADEPGAPTAVHYRLIRLKGAGRAEPQLQEFRASDRVQAERVHARKVRRDSRSSFLGTRPAGRVAKQLESVRHVLD